MIVALVVGALMAIAANFQNKLVDKEIELRNLQNVHTATVETCGQAWLDDKSLTAKETLSAALERAEAMRRRQ